MGTGGGVAGQAKRAASSGRQGGANHSSEAGGHARHRPARKAGKGIDAGGARLAGITRGEYLVAHHQQHPAPRCPRIARQAHRIGEIAERLAADSVDRVHGAAPATTGLVVGSV